MYLGIDVGGSKTLLAVFAQDGKVLEEVRFATPKQYPAFLLELDKQFQLIKEKYKISAICCALPAKIDRKLGIAEAFGNLDWHNVYIKKDITVLFPRTKILLENDANLAGLSEALALKGKYRKVLYLTISTGIGDGVIVDGKIDPVFADSEPGSMILDYESNLQRWEDFASGRALKAKYGKLASEINDEHIWHKYVKGLAKGIDVLVATLSPEVIVIGGGVGSHFNKYGHFLVHELKKYENNMVKMPPIVQAKRPEEAVIYGCYDFIKQSITK